MKLSIYLSGSPWRNSPGKRDTQSIHMQHSRSNESIRIILYYLKCVQNVSDLLYHPVRNLCKCLGLTPSQEL